MHVRIRAASMLVHRSGLRCKTFLKVDAQLDIFSKARPPRDLGIVATSNRRSAPESADSQRQRGGQRPNWQTAAVNIGSVGCVDKLTSGNVIRLRAEWTVRMCRYRFGPNKPAPGPEAAGRRLYTCIVL